LALPRYERALEVDPGFGLGHYNVGLALHGLGRHREAIKAYERGVTHLGRIPWVIGWMAVAYAEMGETGKARALVNELEHMASVGGVAYLAIALALDELGEVEASLDALEKAYERHEPFTYALALEGWLIFRNSRRHPRFAALMQRMGTEPHDTAGQASQLRSMGYR
jgi:tetratricopeptide (TPR) repeat protein